VRRRAPTGSPAGPALDGRHANLVVRTTAAGSAPDVLAAFYRLFTGILYSLRAVVRHARQELPGSGGNIRRGTITASVEWTIASNKILYQSIC
jgi:hypothetical protein